jgi:hypothetical protein
MKITATNFSTGKFSELAECVIKKMQYIWSLKHMQKHVN